MTAATITAPAGHEVTIAEAQAVFPRAKAISPEWPDAGRKAIGIAVWDLAVALRRYYDLRCGIVPRWCPGIDMRSGGLAAVLRMAADDAWEAAEEVTAVIGEYYGAAPAAGGEQS